MDPVTRAPQESETEVAEFIRFCYRRRRAGWPEIYDEMCAVAARGIFKGWTPEDLAERGVAFSLFEMPALAALARRVIAEDEAQRRGSRPAASCSGGHSEPLVEERRPFRAAALA